MALNTTTLYERTGMSEVHPIPTHGKFQNLSGLPFGKLTVQDYAGRAMGDNERAN